MKIHSPQKKSLSRLISLTFTHFMIIHVGIIAIHAKISKVMLKSKRSTSHAPITGVKNR